MKSHVRANARRARLNHFNMWIIKVQENLQLESSNLIKIKIGEEPI